MDIALGQPRCCSKDDAPPFANKERVLNSAVLSTQFYQFRAAEQLTFNRLFSSIHVKYD